MVIEQTGAIASMVASGLGVAILSRWASSPWIENRQLVAVRCGRNGLGLRWRSLMRAGTPTSSPEHQVAALLATWLDER
jgi:DNA-binding transcriptional LysR family regulator